MKKRTMKILGLFLVFGTIIGNTVMTYAADNVCIQEEKQVDEEDWQFLIQEIEKIKEENPNISEEEIVKMVEKCIVTRSDEMKGISDIWNILTESEKKLCVRYPFDALKVNKARNTATIQTEAKFGYSGLGDKSDAFRHGIWNAEMVILIGKEKAELFATAHEDKDISGIENDGFSKEEHKNMDLHNNEVGRNIGVRNQGMNEEMIAQVVYDTIFLENTPFIWLHE